MPTHVDPAIYVAANIGDRRVIARAMQALGISQARAVGHLVMFWGRVAMHVPDGRIGGYTDAQLEGWAGWDGKRGRFAEWLRSQHLDEAQRPHEWDEYAGRLAVSRAKARDKKTKQRNGLGDSVPGTSPGTVPRHRPETDEGQDRGQDPGHHRDITGDSLRARAHTGEKVQSTESTNQEQQPPRAPAREALAAAVTALNGFEPYRVRVTVAANRAITAKWGEQPLPIRANAGASHTVARGWFDAGVPLEFAEDVIGQVITRYPESQRPPGSLSYFAAAVSEAWSHAQDPAVLAQQATGQATGSAKPTARSVAALLWRVGMRTGGLHLLGYEQREARIAELVASGEIPDEAVFREAWGMVHVSAQSLVAGARHEDAIVQALAAKLLLGQQEAYPAHVTWPHPWLGWSGRPTTHPVAA